MSLEENGLYRLYLFEGGLASLAGIEDGDILLSVDGISISAEMNQDEVLSLMRGLVGTEVILIVMDRDSKGDEIEIIIERESLTSNKK